MTDIPLSSATEATDGAEVGPKETDDAPKMIADSSPFGKRDMSKCALNAAFCSVEFERKPYAERKMISIDETIDAICEEPGMFNVAW